MMYADRGVRREPCVMPAADIGWLGDARAPRGRVRPILDKRIRLSFGAGPLPHPHRPRLAFCLVVMRFIGPSVNLSASRVQARAKVNALVAMGRPPVVQDSPNRSDPEPTEGHSGGGRGTDPMTAPMATRPIS